MSDTLVATVGVRKSKQLTCHLSFPGMEKAPATSHGGRKEAGASATGGGAGRRSRDTSAPTRPTGRTPCAPLFAQGVSGGMSADGRQRAHDGHLMEPGPAGRVTLVKQKPQVGVG